MHSTFRCQAADYICINFSIEKSEGTMESAAATRENSSDKLEVPNFIKGRSENDKFSDISAAVVDQITASPDTSLIEDEPISNSVLNPDCTFQQCLPDNECMKEENAGTGNDIIVLKQTEASFAPSSSATGSRKIDQGRNSTKDLTCDTSSVTDCQTSSGLQEDEENYNTLNQSVEPPCDRISNSTRCHEISEMPGICEPNTLPKEISSAMQKPRVDIASKQTEASFASSLSATSLSEVDQGLNDTKDTPCDTSVTDCETSSGLQGDEKNCKNDIDVLNQSVEPLSEKISNSTRCREKSEVPDEYEPNTQPKEISSVMENPGGDSAEKSSCDLSRSEKSGEDTGFPTFFKGLVSVGKYNSVKSDFSLKSDETLIESPSLVSPFLSKESDQFPPREKDVKSENKDFFSSAAGEFLIALGLSRVKEWYHRDMKRRKTRLMKREGKSDSLEQELEMHQNCYSQAKKANEPFSHPLKSCEICCFATESAVVLEGHLLVPHVTPRRKYRCGYCDAIKRDPQEMLIHMKAIHNKVGRIQPREPLYKCNYCNFDSKSEKKLYSHVNCCEKHFDSSVNQAPPKNYEFPALTAKPIADAVIKAYEKSVSCVKKGRGRPRKTKYVPDTSNQMPNSLKDRNVTLPQISKNMNVQDSIIIPPRSVQLSRASPSDTQLQTSTLVTCELCDGYVKDLDQLRTHMQLIHKVKIPVSRPPLNCQNCQSRFFTDQGLERHLLGAHGLVTSNMQELANRSKDAGCCTICGRVCTSELVAHMNQIHQTTLQPVRLSYKCTVCSATFNLYRLFENHVYLVHNRAGKRPSDSDDTSRSRKVAKLSHSDCTSVSNGPAKSTPGEEDALGQKLPVLGNDQIASSAQDDPMNVPTGINSLPNTACSSQVMSSKLSKQSISKTPSPNNQSKTSSLISCEICDGYIASPEELPTHMQLMHKVNISPHMLGRCPPLNCQKCQRRFFSDQGLERHLLCVHGLVTSNMQELAKRVKDAGCCTVCGKVYAKKLVAHMNQIHQLTLEPVRLSYKCSVCSDTFNLYGLFRNHIYLVHSGGAKRPSDGNNNSPSRKKAKLYDSDYTSVSDGPAESPLNVHST